VWPHGEEERCQLLLVPVMSVFSIYWVELTHLRSDSAYNLQPDINTQLKIMVCTMVYAD